MNKKILYLLLLGAYLCAGQLSAQETERDKVLFVGNSLTFFWNVPQLVEAMAVSEGVSLQTAQSTVGGSNLKQHWEGEKDTQTRKRLEEERWSYVVLGDHSRSTLDHKERFHTFGKEFIELVRTKGAEPVLYMTWAYKSNPLMQKTISNEYMELARRTNTRVIPAGELWAEARRQRPDLELFFDDKHQSPEGAYLTALLAYKVLTGRTVANIPNRLSIVQENGEKLYLMFILPETGEFLRTLTDQFDVTPYNLSKL